MLHDVACPESPVFKHGESINDETATSVPPKRGRKPKAAEKKSSSRICLNLWEHEYELFSAAAKRDSLAHFFREAVNELVASKLKEIESPKPVPRGMGTQFTMLVMRGEKEGYAAAAERFGLPLSGLLRAAGLRKAHKVVK